jgi:hypothetical protein
LKHETELLVAAGVVLGAVVLLKNGSGGQYVTFPASDFFQPQTVSAQATDLYQEGMTEDEFILAAWQWVGSTITYEPIGSDIDFNGELIKCLYCWTVDQTLARGKGNCVCKSAVLASILLNYINPERIHMVIGGFSLDGVGGHCWVTVNRNGTDYILEATATPKDPPWMAADLMSEIYIPYAVFSQVDFSCVDHSFCLKVNECDCGRRIQELL